MLREVSDYNSADVLDAYFDLFNAEYYATRRAIDMSTETEHARSRLLQLKECLVVT